VCVNVTHSFLPAYLIQPSKLPLATARPGSLIGQSPDIATAVTLKGNPMHAILRKIAGGSFFLQSASTGMNAGIVLLL
jgi:hypothetical protein